MNSASFFEKLRDHLEPVVLHAIAMAVTIVCIWGFHWLLAHTLCEDATLFGVFPIVYVAHTGDSLAILRFFWKLIKEF